MVEFDTDFQPLAEKHRAALSGLRRNVVTVHGYDRPVLIEGAEYSGIWLECGPLEGAAYGVVDPVVALENHRIFFRRQREDGYFPCWIRRGDAGTGQVQMVVPIAATAWEVYQAQRDRHFLEEAYEACVRWDDWLARYRDTRGLGLCEAFCEYDTGHDNSPRFHGLPKECPEHDARVCPQADTLPFVAPDLSATVYGGRVALARMAGALGRPEEANAWRQKAEATRRALLAWCFDPESACFYDLQADGRLLRVRGDALTRVLSEHVVGQSLFEAIYRRQIRNPQAFWTPYPLPSIAADDPTFVRDIPRNSWGGASQALTALRAPRWFDTYGKSADLVVMMRQWLRALVASTGFFQQLNPLTGEFTPAGDGYSPAMLVMLEYCARLHGTRRAGDHLEWSCLLPEGSTQSRYSLETPDGSAVLEQESGEAVLRLDGREIARVAGPCRVVTDLRGQLLRVVGLAREPQEVIIRRKAGEVRITLGPGEAWAVPPT